VAKSLASPVQGLWYTVHRLATPLLRVSCRYCFVYEHQRSSDDWAADEKEHHYSTAVVHDHMHTYMSSYY